MLVAALVRLAFDVQVDPTGGGVAVGGTEGLDGFAGGPGIGDGGLIERDAFEPRLALERAAIGDGEEDGVLRAGGGELEGEAGPGVGAGDGFGVDVEGHGRHGEGGAGGDGRAVGVADGEVLGAHPAGEFVALADGERDGGGADLGVGILAAGFDAEGFGRGVVDVGVCGGGAVDDGELIERMPDRRWWRRGKRRRSDKERWCAWKTLLGELGYQSLGSVGFVGLWKRVRFVASEGVVGLVDEFGGTYGFGRARRWFGQKVLPQLSLYLMDYGELGGMACK